MLRRPALALLALPLLLALDIGAAAPAGTATAPRVFTITGRGWGHGVGMSQWGAEGLARHGWDYRRILGHYYPGTRLEQARRDTVRVLLADGAASAVVSSARPFRAVDARGRRWLIRPGAHALRAGLRVVAGRTRAVLVPPLRLVPGTQPLRLNGNAYRGELRVTGEPGSLTVVNVLPLELYLRGVVPWEMPHTWHADALRAQAVAARTYAITRLGRNASFDVFADTRDQVYGGLRAETQPSSAAVAATAGEILTWQGRPAATYYFSTSGGRTAAAGDGLPWARRVPYLVSVTDPYDSISPHHDWGPVRVPAARLTRLFGVRGVERVRLVLNGSARVSTVTLVGRDGGRTIAGRDFAAALGLRSSWFTVAGAVTSGRVPPAADPAGTVAPQSADDWPPGRAYTVVVSSAPKANGIAATRALAARVRQAGAPRVGVLDSDLHAGLRAGYLVVFSGVYRTSTEASAAAARLTGRFPGAYPRLIAG